MNSGKAEHVTTLVSLENLGLDMIRAEAGRCHVGAAVTFQELADSSLVPSALRAASRLTASRTLRNMVTVGGELGLLPEDSALIPALIALGADVTLAGKKKPVPIRSFLDQGSTASSSASRLRILSSPPSARSPARLTARGPWWPR